MQYVLQTRTTNSQTNGKGPVDDALWTNNLNLLTSKLSDKRKNGPVISKTGLHG